MNLPSTLRGAHLKDLVPVRTVDDLDWYVKESEIVTGAPGRDFVVAGADRPAFHVRIDHAGYEILRIDVSDVPQAPTLATARELIHHTVGNAMACGLLYTSALQ
jgi:hypothetical protein